MKFLAAIYTGLLLSFSLLSGLNSFSQNTEFWGLIENGVDGFGAIVSTDENGDNYAIEHSFGANSLSNALYADLIEIGNLKFYGVSQGGGAKGLGGLYEYDHSNSTFSLLHSFDYTDGALPGPLVHLNQKIYGLTHREPGVSYGVLYEYNLITKEFIHKIDFDTSNTGSVFSDGLTLASNGKLYGIAGGFLKHHTRGYIFEYDPVNDVYKKLFVFSDSATSGVVLGHMIQASNGKLYGMSYSGGMFDQGVIFEYDILSNQYQALHHFDGLNGGKAYLNSLVEFGDGNFYGMTFREGNFDEGVVFKFDLDSMKYTLVHHFSGGSDGGQAYGNLTTHSNGNLYGMTREGGFNGNGVIFSIDTSTYGMQQVFHFSNNVSGREPSGSLCHASNGLLYSATPHGTQKLHGSIFEFNASTNNFTHLSFFQDRSGGAFPQGQLIHHSNGKLYGVAKGGDGQNGVLFSIDPTSKTFQVAHNFSWKKGQFPTGFICEGSNGMIYGLTEYGGNDSIFGFGVVYKYNPVNKILDTLISLKESVHGRNPTTGWMKGSSEILYTCVDYGGEEGGGSIISLDPSTDEITVLHSFSNDAGQFYRPYGPMIFHQNGKLYGLMARGGTNDKGGIFEFDPLSNSLLISHEFSSNQSGIKYSYITRGPDDLLYGAASQENGNYGSIYSFDPLTKTYNTLYENNDPENGVLGAFNKMLWASNDKLYAFTFQQGLNGEGTFYEFDPANNDFNKLLDFNSANGSKPINSLIEINGDYNYINETEISDNHINLYPNPARNQLHIQYSGTKLTRNAMVIDMNGREVLTLPPTIIEGGIINVSKLRPGLYILHLSSPEKDYRLRFMIE